MRKKGLPQLLKVLSQLPAPVVLMVAGASKQMGAMRALCAAQGLDRRVFFLGSVHDMEIVYAAADCLIHPTLEDTYAMVVLEAMAFALPVVVSGPAYCGISSELTDGVDALMLEDPLDLGAMHRALQRVLEEPQLAATLAHNALTFASARNASRFAEQHKSLYLEQLARRRSVL
jgi:UDP-glucose:(heptosyl)LPS alpha-1,3-glucosyltransferase